MKNAHRIAYRLRPSEWLATEWPSVLLGFGVIAAIVMLCRRGAVVELLVHEDGTIFASEAGAEPVYAHWRGFVHEGATFVLWGADGRSSLGRRPLVGTSRPQAVIPSGSWPSDGR